MLAGDLLPDFSNLAEPLRLPAQRRFWAGYRDAFLRAGMVTTYVLGNHELDGFSDPAMAAVPAQLAGKVVRLQGIPGDPGPFSFSRGWPAAALEAELEAQLVLAPEPEIYIAHAPPYGSLDRTGRDTHIGHRPLFRHLCRRGFPPALVLAGHVHQSFGWERLGGTTVVNLATGYALLDWRDGEARFLAMERLVRGGSFYDSP